MGKKKARSSSSGGGGAIEKVAGNLDLLSEILIRVPLKPLLRLKRVSKRWHALISDKQFRDSHSIHHQRYPNSLIFPNGLDHHGPSSHMILSFNTPTPRALNLDFLNQPVLTVVRSCNGLLLCRGYNTTYFVCNPITRHFTTFNLVRHPFIRKSKIIDLYLAFDPSISPRYKVVSVAATLNSPLEWVFHVYTFKTRSRIGPGVSVSIPFELREEEADNGVYWNGAIHWCSTKSDFCFYFDVDAHCLKNYPMPLSCFTLIKYFGESGGRLHLMLPVNEMRRDLYNHYDIFELKEDYSGWSFMHRIDLNPIRLHFPHINWYWHHVTFYIFHMPKDKNKKKKSSMSVLILGKEGAILHDPVDQNSIKLCDFEMGTPTSLHIQSSLACWNNVQQYYENLC